MSLLGPIPVRGRNAAHTTIGSPGAEHVPEPHLELPHSSISRYSLGQLCRFCLRAHLPLVEMGGRHGQARVAHVCPHRDGGHVEDERQVLNILNAVPWSMYGAAMVRSVQIPVTPGLPGPPYAYLCGQEGLKPL